MSQRQLGDAAGLGYSTIAQIEQGIRTELRPRTFEKLAMALNVHPAYFTTDDPKEFMKIRFSSMTPEEVMRWQEMDPSQRWEWVINSMWYYWGDDWTVTAVAERLGISAESFEKMLSGEWEISNAIHQQLSAMTGVPMSTVLSPDDSISDEILLRYRQAVMAAFRAGLSPQQLEQAVTFLSSIRQE